MNRFSNFALCFSLASLASLSFGSVGCASAPKSAPAQVEAPRTYDATEYTAPEERELYVSSPQESSARKDTQTALQPSLVTQRKAKMLYPLGH